MHRTTLTLLLLACTFTAAATEPQTKRDTQGYAGACQAASVADDARIRRGAVMGTATATASVLCSPVIDTSQNGTKAFGLSLTNTSATVTRTVTCTAQISTAKPGPHLYASRSVLIGPKAHANPSWTAAELGEGKTFRGGQVGIACSLPAGIAVHNVWTQAVGN